jgi:hypothetical protein
MSDARACCRHKYGESLKQRSYLHVPTVGGTLYIQRWEVHCTCCSTVHVEAANCPSHKQQPPTSSCKLLVGQDTGTDVSQTLAVSLSPNLLLFSRCWVVGGPDRVGRKHCDLVGAIRLAVDDHICTSSMYGSPLPFAGVIVYNTLPTRRWPGTQSLSACSNDSETLQRHSCCCSAWPSCMQAPFPLTLASLRVRTPPVSSEQSGWSCWTPRWGRYCHSFMFHEVVPAPTMARAPAFTRVQGMVTPVTRAGVLVGVVCVIQDQVATRGLRTGSTAQQRAAAGDKTDSSQQQKKKTHAGT